MKKLFHSRFTSGFKLSSWLLLSSLLSVPILSASPITKASSTDNALREYHASYQLYWQGVNVGSSEHELRRVGKNLYSAESISKPYLAIMPFGSSERSQFTLEDSKLKPQRYDFKTEEKGRKIVGLLEFDWDTNELHKSIYEGAERNEPLPENAQDRITYNLQLRQDLKNGKGPFTYTVVEPRKIKQYTFNVVGSEKVNTPMGEFKTIKVEHVSDNGERRTQIWLAPDFDYLLVRLIQIRKGKLESEALLKKVQVINSKIPNSSNPHAKHSSSQTQETRDLKQMKDQINGRFRQKEDNREDR